MAAGIGYADVDQDGQGDANVTQEGCLMPAGYVDNDTAFVTRLVAHYHKKMDTSVDSSYLERFDLMSVQRHLKALGTFGYQITVAGSTKYATAIPRTLRYLADVFRRRSRFNRLHTILTTYVSGLDKPEVVNY